MITKPTKSFTLGVLFGTRPEAIKIARLVHLYRKRPENLVVISTGQHAEMLRPILEFFKITPDVDLQLMKPNQTVSDIVWSTIKGLEELGSQIKLNGLFVQGDTASCMAGSLWAFLAKIPVFHIEAGLRSGNLDQPWPEESPPKPLAYILHQLRGLKTIFFEKVLIQIRFLLSVTLLLIAYNTLFLQF